VLGLGLKLFDMFAKLLMVSIMSVVEHQNKELLDIKQTVYYTLMRVNWRSCKSLMVSRMSKEDHQNKVYPIFF